MIRSPWNIGVAVVLALLAALGLVAAGIRSRVPTMNDELKATVEGEALKLLYVDGKLPEQFHVSTRSNFDGITVEVEDSLGGSILSKSYARISFSHDGAFKRKVLKRFPEKVFVNQNHLGLQVLCEQHLNRLPSDYSIALQDNVMGVNDPGILGVRITYRSSRHPKASVSYHYDSEGGVVSWAGMK